MSTSLIKALSPLRLLKHPLWGFPVLPSCEGQVLKFISNWISRVVSNKKEIYTFLKIKRGRKSPYDYRMDDIYFKAKEI